MQTTPEARDAIESADEVFYLTEPVTGGWIRSLNARARPLAPYYREGLPRNATYAAIVDAILSAVRRGAAVCAAFYGHPGVLVSPGHEAIRQARSEGFEARMLPGVSAEDCLVADLGVDPGRIGWQSYEATEFLMHGRTPDTSAGLILWQVGVVGNVRYSRAPDGAHVPVLIEYLGRFYPADHEAVLYEASPFPICSYVARRIALARIGPADVAPLATLYVPPAVRPARDLEIMERLGLAQPSPGA